METILKNFFLLFCVLILMRLSFRYGFKRGGEMAIDTLLSVLDTETKVKVAKAVNEKLEGINNETK